MDRIRLCALFVLCVRVLTPGAAEKYKPDNVPSISELFQLTDRVAIVTGGSRGLGQEMAARKIQLTQDMESGELQPGRGLEADTDARGSRSRARVSG